MPISKNPRVIPRSMYNDKARFFSYRTLSHMDFDMMMIMIKKMLFSSAELPSKACTEPSPSLPYMIQMSPSIIEPALDPRIRSMTSELRNHGDLFQRRTKDQKLGQLETYEI